MAHVALIAQDGTVLEIHVINNSDLPNNGEFSLETEQAVNDFQHSLGLMGNWKLTSYNSKFRERYAQVGGKYDEERDIFIVPDVPEYREEPDPTPPTE